MCSLNVLSRLRINPLTTVSPGLNNGRKLIQLLIIENRIYSQVFDG